MRTKQPKSQPDPYRLQTLLAPDPLSLLRYEKEDRRLERAQCLETSKKILALLADDSSKQVRHAVACHPETSPDVLEDLACDPSSQVRQAVAHHTRAPGSALIHLAQDTSSRVRTTVAANPNTPKRIRKNLAWDPVPEVRCAVMGQDPLMDPYFAMI